MNNWLDNIGKKKFQVGGPGDDKTKTYTNKAEYDKALQAYNDSLALYKSYDSLRKERTETDGFFDSNLNNLYESGYGEYGVVHDPNYRQIPYKQIAPIGAFNFSDNSGVYPVYKKPVVKPEFKSSQKAGDWKPLTAEIAKGHYSGDLANMVYRENGNPMTQYDITYQAPPKQAKGTLEQEVKPTMAKGTMGDDSNNKPIWMPDGTKKGPNDFKSLEAWQKASGQKFAMGGKVPPEDEATMADSLAVYNNAKKLLDYYSSKGYVGNKSTDVISPEQALDVFRYNNNGEGIITDKSGFTHASNGSFKREKNIPEENYFKKVNDYQYFLRDNQSNRVDFRSPMPFYDSRIKAQTTTDFSIPDNSSFLPPSTDVANGDIVNISMYDPLAVKPYIMLTPEEKDLRVKKYGTKGFPDSYGKMPIKSYNSNDLYLSLPIQKVPEMKADTMGSEKYVPFSGSGYGNPNIPQGYWDKGMGKKETEFKYGGWLDK